MGEKIGTATVEKSREISQQIKTSTSISFVLSLNGVWLFATPWTAARQDFLSITNSWSLLKLMSIESVMPSNHLIPMNSTTIWPSNFFPGSISKKININLKRYMHPNVQSSTIYNSQDKKAT